MSTTGMTTFLVAPVFCSFKKTGLSPICDSTNPQRKISASALATMFTWSAAGSFLRLRNKPNPVVSTPASVPIADWPNYETNPKSPGRVPAQPIGRRITTQTQGRPTASPASAQSAGPEITKQTQPGARATPPPPKPPGPQITKPTQLTHSRPRNHAPHGSNPAFYPFVPVRKLPKYYRGVTCVLKKLPAF
jgi:hypothetical protein